MARCLAIRPGPASAQGCRRQALDPRRGCLCRSHSGAFGYALLQTSSIGGVFRVDFCVVVTNVVNPTAFSLKIKVFGRRLTTFVTETLERRCESRWFDDVCNVGRPLVARPGPDAAHGRCGQALPTRRPGCLKPLSPLRACACVGLKPSSPLRVLVEPRLKPPSPLPARARVGLKPASPLRVPAEPQLKPPSPLRVRIGCFWRVFRLHWCCRFQWVLFRGEHW